ncbi:MAG: endolytic transglycosylase MltG [bacterium]|nr:endolytic transglycosylase MltG [bacterium]
MIVLTRKKLWIGALVGFLLFVLIFITIFAPVSRKSSMEVIFSIKKGEGSREIGYNLQRYGLIRSSPLFRMYAVITGVSFKLQAGDYLLSPSMSLFDMVRKFTTGDVIQEKLTIIEGWIIKDIEDYFAKKGRVIEISPDLEGYLFPDTYHIPNTASNKEIVGMMRENFEKKFNNDLRQETLRQGKTIAQIITMASLLEKEVKTLEDKKLVAGVLWKRLSIGMALQVDAAPITYAVQGLPAGPISNPGLESIQAALYSTDNPYWYYLSTPEGPPGGEASKTIFSRTLGEHNIAKARYLKN